MEPWIQTRSNQILNYINPDPGTIDIDDIAVALSRTARFGGHTTSFYSVAQHSFLASLCSADDTVALYALLHDAHEAYTGDIPAPLKILLPGIEDIEKRIQSAIYVAIGIPEPDQDVSIEVKNIDGYMLSIEKDALFTKNMYTVLFAPLSTPYAPTVSSIHEQLYPTEYYVKFIDRLSYLLKTLRISDEVREPVQ